MKPQRRYGGFLIERTREQLHWQIGTTAATPPLSFQWVGGISGRVRLGNRVALTFMGSLCHTSAHPWHGVHEMFASTVAE